MDKKDRRSVRLNETLSFRFSVLFSILSVIIITITGIYSYFDHINTNRERCINEITTAVRYLIGSYGTAEYDRQTFDRIRDLGGLSFICRIMPSADLSKTICTLSSPDDDTAFVSDTAVPDVSVIPPRIWTDAEKTGDDSGIDLIFDKTVSRCFPIDPENRKAGMIWAGIDISDYEREAVLCTVRFEALLAVIIVGAFLLALRNIHKYYSSRIMMLSDSIEEYTRIKDSGIAGYIRENSKGSDEISVLSQHTASMISEMQKHIDKIMTISGELLSANERAERFSELAHKDAMTGLESKMSYYEAINRIDEEIRSGKAQFAIIIIDLNNLKKINDELGHNHGDLMIKKLADLIGSYFFEYHAYRIGGDEFAVIIEGEDSRSALALTANFRSFIESQSGKYKSVPFSAAVGCSNFRKGVDKSTQDVFERADNEMYGNKIQMKAVRKD